MFLGFRVYNRGLGFRGSGLWVVGAEGFRV